jgi:ABC-type sulfate transport system permease component
MGVNLIWILSHYRSWATIFILGFGNFAALDFQSRCMAAQTPRMARYACFIASAFTLLIGIPFSYLGAVTRYEFDISKRI